MRQIITRVLSILAFLSQAVILDYYIISKMGSAWAPCIIADVITIIVMIWSFIYAHRYFALYDALEHDENRQFACDDGKSKARSGPGPKTIGILPFIYLTWFVYSCFLAAKIAIIFKTFGSELSGEEVWGTNLLEFVIAGKIV